MSSLIKFIDVISLGDEDTRGLGIEFKISTGAKYWSDMRIATVREFRKSG